MTTTSTQIPENRDITDILLWLGAAAVAGIGLSWLFLAQPWAATGDSARPVASPALTTTRLPTTPAADRLEVPARSADETLRMAQLAYDSGMLIEPERYSAWSLYLELIDADPTHAEALEGRRRIADALVERAAVALEQGRTDAADQSLEGVLGAVPDHPAALRLAARSRELGEQSAAPRVTLAPSVTEAVAATSRPEPLAPVARAAPAAVNPLDELGKNFDAALAAGKLLQPDTGSAHYFLTQMVALNRDSARTVAARESLFATLLERATAAIEGFDSAGAAAWIDAAEAIGDDPSRILQIRDQLMDRRIAAESQTPLPAAELAITNYVPPRYPRAAVTLARQGWVDVEFIVGLDGQTSDITVTAASHDDLFRDEAVAAVEQWRFEPRVILGRPIEQTAFTRIRFALE
jgi:TonB family protein